MKFVLLFASLVVVTTAQTTSRPLMGGWRDLDQNSERGIQVVNYIRDYFFKRGNLGSEDFGTKTDVTIENVRRIQSQVICCL